MQHSLIEGNEETIAAPKAFSDDLDNLIKNKLVTFIEAETQSVEDVLSAVQKATMKGPSTIIVLGLGGGVGIPKIDEQKCSMMQCYAEELKELTPKVTHFKFSFASLPLK